MVIAQIWDRGIPRKSAVDSERVRKFSHPKADVVEVVSGVSGG